MRVVVTGADGYIGRVLARRLRQLGHEVTGFDIGLFAGCSFEEQAATWRERRIDVRDVRADDFGRIEAVCHLAALSNDPLGAIDPALTREINYEGTLRVARAAKEAGVRRFIFASSCSVYGRQPDGAAAHEGSPLAPLAQYARSRIVADRDAVHDRALNVGADSENRRIRDLATVAAETVGAPVTTGAGATADPRSYRVSFAGIRERMPAWSPRRSAADGAREMRDALVRSGFVAADFEDERFTRLRRLVARRDHGELDAALRPVTSVAP